MASQQHFSASRPHLPRKPLETGPHRHGWGRGLWAPPHPVSRGARAASPASSALCNWTCGEVRKARQRGHGLALHTVVRGAVQSQKRLISVEESFPNSSILWSKSLHAERSWSKAPRRQGRKGGDRSHRHAPASGAGGAFNKNVVKTCVCIGPGQQNPSSHTGGG